MDYSIIFIIFLSLYISLSYCIEEGVSLFNITEIGVIGCNETLGIFQFWIGTNNLTEIYHQTQLIINLESPANGESLCSINETNFTCYVPVYIFPLTEKKVVLPKEKNYSPTEYYDFVNWKKFMDKNNVIAKNVDCVPIIRNTFKYSSVENNGTYNFTIKGEWSDHSISIVCHDSIKKWKLYTLQI